MNLEKEKWVNETIAFLALGSIKGIGFQTLYNIASSGESFRFLLKDLMLDQFERKFKVKIGEKTDWERYRKDIWSMGQVIARELAHAGIAVLFKEQTGFPEKLKKIPSPPQWIFVQGDRSNFNKETIGIVGARKASEDGYFLTKYLVSALHDKVCATVSGLASGIDQMAHTESLRYDIPTIGILGHGINVEYPKGSLELREEIIKKGGTIITEYLPEQKPSASTFVRRNRLQAALSTVLVPVEWEIKSGTAHTVEFASRYGKRIVNLYLPGTYENRKELAFSEKERKALSFEIPKSHDEFMQYLENIGFDWIREDSKKYYISYSYDDSKEDSVVEQESFKF